MIPVNVVVLCGAIAFGCVAANCIQRSEPFRSGHADVRRCLALCELTEEEVDAIAEHEQISETVAVELGSYLIHGPDGQLLIQRMIIDDIQAARRRGM